MIEHLEMGFSNAVRQMIVGCVGFVLLACLLNFVGGKLKSVLVGLGGVGRALLYPGKWFSDAGNWIACAITGTHMRRHVLSDDDRGRTRSITHTRNDISTPKGLVRSFVVLTAPIWFGCLLLIGITMLVGGLSLLPHAREFFAGGEVDMIGYVSGVISEALAMFVSMVCVWHWTSPFYLFCLLCFVSVATEMSISPRQIASIKGGLFLVFLILVVVNAIPGMSAAIAAVGKMIRPIVFALQVILLFVIIFDFVALMFFGVVGKIFGRKSRKS